MSLFQTVKEAGPSLVSHYMNENHVMTATCWCKPFLQHQAFETTVMHNAHAGAALLGWPFAGEGVWR